MAGTTDTLRKRRYGDIKVSALCLQVEKYSQWEKNLRLKIYIYRRSVDVRCWKSLKILRNSQSFRFEGFGASTER